MRPAARRRVAAARLAALGIEPRRWPDAQASGVDDGQQGATTGQVARVAAEVVRWHGAMQAQDLASGLWSLGVRTGASQEQLVAAVDAGHLTRSWPMRGTLHWLAAEDVGWMTDLLAGPAVRAAGRVLVREGIDDAVVGRAADAWVGVLVGGGSMNRDEARKALTSQGIDGSGQKCYHLLVRLSQQGLLCQGPVRVTASGALDPTFVLREEWVTAPRQPGREEAMALLIERYVRSHGPVTERDAATWCDQTLGFVREAVAHTDGRVRLVEVEGAAMLVDDAAQALLEGPATDVPGEVHLLPGFDEWLLGYRDRSAQLTREQEAVVVPGGNGMFRGTLVDRGLVIGTWRRSLRTRRGSREVDLEVVPFAALPARAARGLEVAAQRYAAFLGAQPRLRTEEGPVTP